MTAHPPFQEHLKNFKAFRPMKFLKTALKCLLKQVLNSVSAAANTYHTASFPDRRFIYEEAYHFKDIGWVHFNPYTNGEKNKIKLKKCIKALNLKHKYPLPDELKN